MSEAFTKADKRLILEKQLVVECSIGFAMGRSVFITTATTTIGTSASKGQVSLSIVPRHLVVLVSQASGSLLVFDLGV